jgi:diaminohydroxyphosphoribosylaminopyrimidine deaminase/5-amino-6-(5-phosphoribosylamino)uracil reductase
VKRSRDAVGGVKVTLKAAITLDGRIATQSGDSKWITSKPARTLAHRMRAEHDAVLVGIGTVLADDPELTVRLVKFPKTREQPLRVVLDSKLRTPLTSKVAQIDERTRTLIVHGPSASAAKRRRLSELGIDLAEVPEAGKGELDLRAVSAVLGIYGIRSVLVEGGGATHGAWLRSGLAKRVALFIAPKLLADSFAKPLASGPARKTISDAIALKNVRYRRVGPDLLVTGLLKSPPKPA